MLNNKTIFLFALTATFAFTAQAQLYKDPKAPVQKRVADLLKRMTLEEKVGQMSMSSLTEAKNSKIAYGVLESPFTNVRDVALKSAAAKKYSREQTRLGIPPIQIGECLHGQLAAGATTFPSALLMQDSMYCLVLWLVGR